MKGGDILVKNKLYIITLSGYRDALKPSVTDENCKAVLLNLENADYVLNQGVLYYNGSALSEEYLFELAANPNFNHPIKEGVLVHCIFSFLYSKCDLRNRAEFETSENEINKYLGVSTGHKGFKLLDKIKELSNVYGIIEGKVFNLIEVEDQQSNLQIRCLYLHILLNTIIDESFNRFGERAKYYTDKVSTEIISVKNKTAALIVIELAGLVARSRGTKCHITLKNLFYRVPQLMAIYLSKNSTSQKNQQLRRSFNIVDSVFQNKTEIPNELVEFEIVIPEVDIRNLDAVINISFKTYKKYLERR